MPTFTFHRYYMHYDRGDGKCLETMAEIDINPPFNSYDHYINLHKEALKEELDKLGEPYDEDCLAIEYQGIFTV